MNDIRTSNAELVPDGERPLDRHLPYVAESSARAFQRDLYFYWSTVRANPLSLTKEGRLYKRDLKLVNGALLHQVEIDRQNELDIPRLLFLRLFLTDMGLLRRVGATIQAVEKATFLEQSPADRIRQCYTHWREGTFWNEMLSIPNVSVYGVESRLDPIPAQLVQARARVIGHIAGLFEAQEPETHWTPIAQLIDRIRAADYEFLLPRDYFPFHSIYYRTYENYVSHASPYISYGNEMGWSFSPPFADEAEGWSVVEAGYIRAILLEPLHWMGLLDIGYIAERAANGSPSGDATPVAYRLTPVGAWVLGVGPQVDMPEEQGRVVVQPNFELFALDPISDLTLARLDEFAERVNAERAIKYRLTRESVYRAQKKGWTVARVIDVLGKLNQPTGPGPSAGAASLPQNVVRTLQEWQDLYERITIHRRANLLQAVNGELLARLKQEHSIRSHLVEPGGDEEVDGAALALISPALGETEELVRALERAGYPPLRTRSPRDAVRPSLTIAAGAWPAAATGAQATVTGVPATVTGMEIKFHVALPSIYLYEQIAPFTRQDEQGRYYLTQSAVQDAVQGGMAVDEILDRLRALHRGPLPHAVESQVRAWGGYYGDAAVQTVTLIQVRDGKTLNELLAEPEVRALLRPFVPDPARALALLDAGDLEQLYQVLARYGIDVHDQLAQAALVAPSGDE
jgi:hypothetical protein